MQKTSISWTDFSSNPLKYRAVAIHGRGPGLPGADAGGGQMVKKLHVLSLGAGVQSTAVYLMAMEGAFHLDAAIFADTGDEPLAVYRHLRWLTSLGGPRIYRVSKGIKLSDTLMIGESSTRQRFAAVPFFTIGPSAKIGMTRRQCSREFKVEVIERAIRRDLLNLRPRQRIPKTVDLQQYFGISLDEARRSIAIKERVKRATFPLLDLRMTRQDCVRWLSGRVPHEVPKSACVYCPYHSDAEWMKIRAVPEDWALAVKVDTAIRQPGNIVNRNMDAQMFAHRSCVPLAQVEFKHERQLNMFTGECEGMCGI